MLTQIILNAIACLIAAVVITGIFIGAFVAMSMTMDNIHRETLKRRNQQIDEMRR